MCLRVEETVSLWLLLERLEKGIVSFFALVLVLALTLSISLTSSRLSKPQTRLLPFVKRVLIKTRQKEEEELGRERGPEKVFCVQSTHSVFFSYVQWRVFRSVDRRGANHHTPEKTSRPASEGPFCCFCCGVLLCNVLRTRGQPRQPSPCLPVHLQCTQCIYTLLYILCYCLVHYQTTPALLRTEFCIFVLDVFLWLSSIHLSISWESFLFLGGSGSPLGPARVEERMRSLWSAFLRLLLLLFSRFLFAVRNAPSSEGGRTCLL